MKKTVESIQMNWKRYLLSSCITFVAGFTMTILAQWDNLTAKSLENGLAISVLLTGVRAGTKLVLESFIAWYTASGSNS